MATDSNIWSRKRRRLRNIISSRTEQIPSWTSISTEPPRPTGSEQESSALSGTQSTSKDPAAQPSGTTTSTAEGTTATSTLCGEILEKALRLLGEPERAIIQEYIVSDDIASALEHALEAAQEKRKVCESRRWSFTMGRHTVKLQDEADKVILWLDRFKQVGDVAVNADPIHAGLPWAGIRLLLEAAVSETHQMEALLVGLKTALHTMNRLRAYMEYLLNLPASQSQVNFESVLIEFHAHILQFLASAIKLYQKRTLSRAFDAFWKPYELINFERGCDRIAARAEIEASNCDRTLSAIEREETNTRKKHLEKVLTELEELRSIGETINTLANKIDLARLPSVDGAAFDSYQDELDARCHPETRVDLLRQINHWADDRQGRCIFWLNGMAGTGKSTISRTVAQTFANAGRLGASFFFKRGEGERGNASRFFTTIASQLVSTVSAIVPYLSAAVDAHPDISRKMMKEQFKNLIFDPLSEVGKHSATMIERVIVIDALDECEREGDIRNILHLLSQTQQLKSIHLRIFLTSRPELPTRLGFKNISAGVHQDVTLHEIAKSTVKDDIASFLTAEFRRIRDDYNNSRPEESFLPEDWPGEQIIQALSDMAVPLFIFAATVSRFVGDRRWDPKKPLANVLKYQMNGQTPKLDQTYLPVLDNLMADLSDSEKDDLAQEFRAVVGSIVLLAEPLGAGPLAQLLDIDIATIYCRLDSLHSVLSIPSSPEAPIRLLHLSFREFILDPYKRGKSLFWVNETERHEVIVTRCLERMSECLRENICRMEFPGKAREDVDQATIEDCLPVDVRYACRYWVYHVIESKGHLEHQDAAYSFLRQHFLHWLEALSLIGRISESIGLIGSLQSIAATNRHPQLSLFLCDARRFILRNRSIIDKAPLQLYCSAIIFTPQESIIRNTFEKPIPWISGLPKVIRTGDFEVQTLEGHSRSVNDVAFSSDGQLLASASGDRTVRIWNLVIGEQMHQLEGHRGTVNAVAFSPNGQLLASAFWDNAVGLWNVATGEQFHQLEGHSGSVNAVVFSADGQLLASASNDKTVRLWNPATGEEVRQLDGHGKAVRGIAFPSFGQLLASGSCDTSVRLWNPATGEQVQRLEGHNNWVNAVAFSTDGRLLASASDDKTIKLWNPATGEEIRQLVGHSMAVTGIAFSAYGQLLASASMDNTIRLWNPATGEQAQRLDGHSGWFNAVTFSTDSQLLALASGDKTVRLWGPTTGEQSQQLGGHDGMVIAVVFSINGRLLASAATDKTVKLWDPTTGEQIQQLQGHSEMVNAVEFSPDCQLLASASSDKTVRLWRPNTGEQVHQLEGHRSQVHAVAFSTDGQLLASASWDKTIRLWNPATGDQLQQLEGHSGSVNAVVFSADGQLLASASNDKTVRLWNPGTGEQLHQLEGHITRAVAVAFSVNSRLLASASWDKTVRLWNPATREELQQFNVFKAIHGRLRFSDDERYLETDRGNIQLHSDQCVNRSIKPQTLSILNEDWITHDNKNFLWLPADYRGGVFNCFARRGNVLAIGTGSGHVHFYNFNT